TAVMGKKLAKIPADETTECRPTDYYGVTKLEAEKLVREAGGIVVRSADVYGPGFTEGYYDLFGLIGSGRMRIFGDGKNRIQYVHIRDLMRALVLAEHFGRPGEVYIITGPDARTQEELYKMVADRLDVAPPSRHISPWLAKMAAKFKGKESFVPIIEKLAADRVFDISKAKRELGYEPKITYEVGIGEVIDEYKKEKVRLDLLRMRKSQQASQASSSFESGWESP
ncbi:MAG: GDP-mannose 4,6-dehydratase, partial [Candidatus Aenigmatarchaeota archaeon]